MNYQQTTQTDLEILKDPERLEELFKPVWQKIREAGTLIQTLRGEKAALEAQVHELESAATKQAESLDRQLAAVREELAAREQELKRLRNENAQMIASGGRQTFSAEEREILKERIRELIAKINSYI